MMLFPVVARTDDGVSYAVTIPDIPGCFTSGSTLQEALDKIQEAVERHLEGAGQIPRPGSVQQYIRKKEYKNGVWIVVGIDLSFLEAGAETQDLAEEAEN